MMDVTKIYNFNRTKGGCDKKLSKSRVREIEKNGGRNDSRSTGMQILSDNEIQS